MTATQKGCEMFECRTTDSPVRPFKSPLQHVAAIDIGTMNCSLVYLLQVDRMKEPMKVKPGRLKIDGYYRVPHCVLFDKSGRIRAFGRHAQRLYYRSMKRDDMNQVFFFQNIKMQLQHDRVS